VDARWWESGGGSRFRHVTRARCVVGSAPYNGGASRFNNPPGVLGAAALRSLQDGLRRIWAMPLAGDLADHSHAQPLAALGGGGDLSQPLARC
jgi:hypothetical protein